MIKDYSQLPRIWGTQIKSFQSVSPGDTIEIDAEIVELMHGMDLYNLQMQHIEDMAASVGCFAKVEEYTLMTNVIFKLAEPLLIELEDRPALTVAEGVIDTINCFHYN